MSKNEELEYYDKLVFGFDPRMMVEISGPELNDVEKDKLENGVIKHLKILYKPFGGNSLFFYNQDLTEIKDDYTLYHSECIIFTNQARMPNEDLVGFLKLNGEIRIYGHVSLRNRLVLRYCENEYTFKDEFSFLGWNSDALKQADVSAYMQ